VNETNRRTELLVLQLYMFWAAFLPIIRSSQLYIGIGTFCAVVMTVCYQEQVIKSAKCTNAAVQLRTPDDGQKGCPKHVEL